MDTPVGRTGRASHILAVWALCTGLAAWPGTVRAAPLTNTPGRLASSTVAIGNPTTSVTLRVETKSGRIFARANDAVSDVRGRSVLESSVERVELASGLAVAVLRVRTEAESRAFVVSSSKGEADFLWNGRLDLTGDLGERTRERIEISDFDGDGKADVVVGEQREGWAICGQDAALLFPRAVDPSTLRLRPVSIRRLPKTATFVEVRAEMQPPQKPTNERTISRFHFQQVSSSAASETKASRLEPPLGLQDGTASTVWAEGVPGDGEWEFVTGTRTEAFKITTFKFTLPPAMLARQPRSLYLVGDLPPMIHVTLPDAPEGSTVWVTPPKPLAWTCLSVVLDAAPIRDGEQKASPVGLAEVESITELDGLDPRGAAQALVEALSAEGRVGSQAARALERLGEEGIRATRAAFLRLSPIGRRRASALFRARAQESAEARNALLFIAKEGAPDIATPAARALIALGATAGAELAELAAEATPDGDQAAVALAHTEPTRALERALELLGVRGGENRRALRSMLVIACTRAQAVALPRLKSWTPKAPPEAAAVAALALGTEPALRPAALDLALRAISSPLGFSSRFRIAEAAANLPFSTPLDGYLEARIRTDPTWMVRARSLRSMVARTPPLGRDLARYALAHDAYPRVRVAAAEALANDESASPLLEASLEHDPWPMVRTALLAAMPKNSRTGALARKSLSDASSEVRAGAIARLRTDGDRGAARQIAARLRDDTEWPDVIREGIDYARALCSTEMTDSLVAVLRRGLAADAWPPDTELAAAAFVALRALGKEEEARTIVARAPGSGGLHDALLKTPTVALCGARAAPKAPNAGAP